MSYGHCLKAALLGPLTLGGWDEKRVRIHGILRMIYRKMYLIVSQMCRYVKLISNDVCCFFILISVLWGEKKLTNIFIKYPSNFSFMPDGAEHEGKSSQKPVWIYELDYPYWFSTDHLNGKMCRQMAPVMLKANLFHFFLHYSTLEFTYQSPVLDWSICPSGWWSNVPIRGENASEFYGLGKLDVHISLANISAKENVEILFHGLGCAHFLPSDFSRSLINLNRLEDLEKWGFCVCICRYVRMYLCTYVCVYVRMCDPFRNLF